MSNSSDKYHQPCTWVSFLSCQKALGEKGASFATCGRALERNRNTASGSSICQQAHDFFFYFLRWNTRIPFTARQNRRSQHGLHEHGSYETIHSDHHELNLNPKLPAHEQAHDFVVSKVSRRWSSFFREISAIKVMIR